MGSKDALETRWWNLVLDRELRAFTVRNGSCGDKVLTVDVPRIMRALEDLGLASRRTAVLPWRVA